MQTLSKEALHRLKSVVGQLRSQGLSQREALLEAKKRFLDIYYYATVYNGLKNVKVADSKPYREILNLLEDLD